jgi:hypothetical protein
LHSGINELTAFAICAPRNGTVLDTYLAKTMEPVVAIDENDSSVSHSLEPQKKKNPGVWNSRHRGG